MNNAYYKLVNEGGEGYTQPAAPKAIDIEEKLFRLKSDLKDAVTDGLEYKASRLREELAIIEAQIAAQ